VTPDKKVVWALKDRKVVGPGYFPIADQIRDLPLQNRGPAIPRNMGTGNGLDPMLFT